MDSMIRVLVADDHSEVRFQIVQLIGRAGDMVVSAEAAGGVEVLERFRASEADVLLLDLSMPRKGGMDTLRELVFRGADRGRRRWGLRRIASRCVR